MPVSVSVTVVGATELAAYFDRVAADFLPALDRATAEVADQTAVAARAAIRPQQGPRLDGSQPGALAASLLPIPLGVGAGIVRYSVESSLVYSRIQDLGGTVTANGNSGGDGVWLVFQNQMTGAWAKVHSVTIPAKHYMEEGATVGALAAEGILLAAMTEVFA